MNSTIFLSHSSRDKQIAFALKAQLEIALEVVQPKIFVSSAPDGIDVGLEWFQDVMSNLEAADSFILLVTPNSMKSYWVFFEFGYFWSKAHDMIFPLRVPDTPIPSPINERQAKLITDDAEFRVFLNSLQRKLDTTPTNGKDIWLDAIKIAVDQTSFSTLHPTIKRAKEMLLDPDENTMKIGADTLREAEDNSATRILREVAQDSRFPKNQIVAAVALAIKSNYADELAIPGLERGLQNEGPGNITCSILKMMNSSESAAALFRGWQKVQSKKPIIDALIDMSDESVIPHLRFIWRNPSDGRIYTDILDTLAKRQDKKIIPDIVEFLNSEHTHTPHKIKIIESLTNYDPDIYVDLASEVLKQCQNSRKSEEQEVFKAALNVLEKSGDRHALELLQSIEPSEAKMRNYLRSTVERMRRRLNE